MATTVESLFGVTPQALQAQRNAALQQQALQFAQLDPAQQAQMQLYMGGNRLAGAVGGMLGAQDPELARATAIEAAAKEADFQTPGGLLKYAQAIQKYDPQKALAAAQQAQILRKNIAEASKVELSAKQEEQLRRELAALGPNATEQQINSVVSKYGSPDKILATLTASQDRAAQRTVQLQNAQLAADTRLDAARIAGETKETIARLTEESKAAQRDLQTQLATLSSDTRIQIARETAESRIEAARERGASAETIARITTEANQNIARITAESRESSARIAAESRETVARTAAESRDQAAQLAAESRAAAAQMQVDARIQAAELAAQNRLDVAQQQGASREAIAQLMADNRKELTQLRTAGAKEIALIRNSATTGKPLAASLQTKEDEDLKVINSLEQQVQTLEPAYKSLVPDPKTGRPLLTLGLVDNAKYQLLNATGRSTAQSRAFADLQRAVQAATNLKVSAEKGVQTDKDVLRFANELIAAYGNNDNKVMAQALKNFIDASAKAKKNTEGVIQSRRKAQKVEPYQFESATPRVIKLD